MAAGSVDTRMLAASSPRTWRAALCQRRASSEPLDLAVHHRLAAGGGALHHRVVVGRGHFVLDADATGPHCGRGDRQQEQRPRHCAPCRPCRRDCPAPARDAGASRHRRGRLRLRRRQRVPAPPDAACSAAARLAGFALGLQVLVGPLEVGDVLLDLVVAQPLVGHRDLLLLEHRLGLRVALQHLLGRLQPAREPGLIAALGDAEQVGAELVAARDRVAGQALRFEGELAASARPGRSAPPWPGCCGAPGRRARRPRR